LKPCKLNQVVVSEQLFSIKNINQNLLPFGLKKALKT